MKLLLILLLWVTNLATAEIIDKSQYKLVLEEEFDGPDLNINLWNYELNERQSAINSKDAVEISNGLLKIRPFTKNNQHYSAVITTENYFEFNRGYIEIKLKFSPQAGVWESIWLYNHKVALDQENYLESGLEVDLLENRLFDFNGKNIGNYANMGLHWNGYQKYHKCVGVDTGDIGLNDGEFHVLGLLWDDNGFKFYIDSKKIWEYLAVNTNAKLFLILSAEVGYLEGWSLTPPKELSGDPVLTVDSIRIWQLKKEDFKKD